MGYLVDPRGRGSHGAEGVFMGKGLIAALGSFDPNNCLDDVGLLCVRRELRWRRTARVRAIRPVSLYTELLCPQIIF